MISPDLRRRFDSMLDEIIAGLPQHLHDLLEDVPLIVEDHPSRQLLDDLHIDPRQTTLCGLHSGIPLTRRSVEQSGHIPDQMMLFRESIYQVSGWRTARDDAALREQIRITLLHEIGHHFGLDEDDLEKLGYG